MALFIIIIVLVIALWIYLKFVRDPEQVRKACNGKTDEQKQVIRYFLVNGCLRKKTISDAEYDAIVAKTLLNVKQEGMDKIGLDEEEIKEIEPVHFENFEFDFDSYHKKGDDGKYRSSKYEITWIFFSDTQVHLFKKQVSFDKDKNKIFTEEYFFKDITNFSTVTEEKSFKIGGATFKVDRTQFKLVVPGDSFLCAMEQNEYTESAIRGMKAKLREKKQA